MVDIGANRSRGQQRGQTDESLQAERDKADDVAEKRTAVEQVAQVADEVVRVARQRADDVVQLARDRADHKHLFPQAEGSAAQSERERSRDDLILERERAGADAALERQRAERKRYLADFLAVEREATDKDLVDERQDADSAIAARDEFLANVSHDLRSLLGGLSLNAGQVLRQAPEGAGGDVIRTHAGRSQRLIARMNRLVNDLLDIASIEAGKLELVVEQFDVAKLLGDTMDAFDPIAAAKRVMLDCEASAPTLRARIDGGRILQVLANLVGNAIKFTPAEGRVTIKSAMEGGQVHFEVTDNGIGVPEDAISGLFERFRQVSKDRRGLGLGLHISKCIVEAHGGKMWAQSQVGVGSTFHFVVPVVA